MVTSFYSIKNWVEGVEGGLGFCESHMFTNRLLFPYLSLHGQQTVGLCFYGSIRLELSKVSFLLLFAHFFHKRSQAQFTQARSAQTHDPPHPLKVVCSRILTPTTNNDIVLLSF